LIEIEDHILYSMEQAIPKAKNQNMISILRLINILAQKLKNYKSITILYYHRYIDT